MTYKSNYRFKEECNKDEKEEDGCDEFKAWIKYLIIQEGKPLSNNFFFNSKFDSQKFLKSETIMNTQSPEDKLKLVKEHLESETDSFGSLDIPSAFSFFGMLDKGNIYLLDDRHQNILHTHDLVELGRVKKLVNEGEYKEGSCMRLVETEKRHFIICFQDSVAKGGWIQFIYKHYPHLVPKDKQPDKPASDSDGELDIPGFPKAKPADCGQKDTKKVDGVWKVLQEWSQCNVVCGGGTQTYQRLCIPPQNGGKECEGEALQTRACNEDPCQLPAAKPIMLPPKIKLQKVTNRMQRYEPCIINEGDIEVVETQLVQFRTKPRLPGWAVLNNRTLSVFMGEKYDQLAFVVKLDQILEVKEWEQEDPQTCFVVQAQNDKSVTLCAMKNSKLDLSILKQLWMDRIEFFKKHCIQGNLQNIKIPVDKTLEMKKEAIEKMEQEEVKEVQEEASSGGSEGGGGGGGGAGQALQESIGDFQQMAMEAMTKEMKYEQMIEAEEKQREKNLDETVATKYEEVCEKEDTLKHGLKKTEQKKQKKASQSFDIMQFDDLKNQIKEMILKKRKDKNDKIALMRKLSEMRREKKQGQLQQKKMEMAGEVMKAQKEGNCTQCTQVSSEEDQCEYCSLFFKDDIQDLQDCKDPTKYCYICCENEFGETHADEREHCFEECAGLGKKPSAAAASNNGQWVWVPKVNKVT